MKHISVFNNEAISWLNIRKDGVYVDTTLGAAGHSKVILQALFGGDGELISFDFDSQAIQNFAAWLKENPELQQKVKLVESSFSRLEEQLAARGVIGVDGILADLGWSSDQLEHIQGLSYLHDEHALDMRLDASLKNSASDILNRLNPEELMSMFTSGGLEYKEAKTLITSVVSIRPTEWTVGRFNEVVELVSSKRKHNLLARTYQALRIKVNHEVENLNALLDQALKVLRPQGRLVIISFHSLEEQIIHQYFSQNLSRVENLITQNLEKGIGHLKPSVAELRANIHAHSAKLWAISKK